MVSPPSETAAIRALARHAPDQACMRLGALIGRLFDLRVTDIKIRHDQYSLNSLNGFLEADGDAFFFKFHQEEGEDATAGEYYRADILAEAGLPVDRPVHVSRIPGEQILLYRRRADPRFSDVLRAIELNPDFNVSIARAVRAEIELNKHVLTCARRNLHPITAPQSAAEPIHRLFHHRLVSFPQGSFPGGRLERFYLDRDFLFPAGISLNWRDFCCARPVINGLEYRHSLGEMFERANHRFRPEVLADAGGTVSHGDAHNANVWYERGAEVDHLTLFDPAFAGASVPSLLGEVKPTFHNIFAHPFWLYDAEIAAQNYNASLQMSRGRLLIETDWQLSPLREALLQAKAETFWKPWLDTLDQQRLLPEDWEDVIRIGLFLCPTLVMNLNAAAPDGAHNPFSSTIGLAVALASGSPPRHGSDMFTRFFDLIRPNR